MGQMLESCIDMEMRDLVVGPEDCRVIHGYRGKSLCHGMNRSMIYSNGIAGSSIGPKPYNENDCRVNNCCYTKQNILPLLHA
jgi:hypothetical protein